MRSPLFRAKSVLVVGTSLKLVDGFLEVGVIVLSLARSSFSNDSISFFRSQSSSVPISLATISCSSIGNLDINTEATSPPYDSDSTPSDSRLLTFDSTVSYT